MHKSSFLKAEFFLKHYGGSLPKEGDLHRVLEIGAKSYGQDTYKPLFPADKFKYTGLDIEDGPNVDIVPNHVLLWEEIADESYDLCISGQTFEHNPFFWGTFSEIARVLSPGGYAFIVAPGAGPVHRYPFDCWRFYPDSWRFLCLLSGMELVEDYYERDHTASIISGGRWRDSALIARKPDLQGAARDEFYEQQKRITAAFPHLNFSDAEEMNALGPCFKAYEESVTRSKWNNFWKNLESTLKLHKLSRIYPR